MYIYSIKMLREVMNNASKAVAEDDGGEVKEIRSFVNYYYWL